MSIKRAAAIPYMRRAVAKGQSRASFLRELSAKGLTYRKTTMLADWRSEANVEAKKGLMKYVRKDRIPTKAIIAEVAYKLPKEYMYVVNIYSQKHPDEPIVMSEKVIHYDELLTPERVEAVTYEQIKKQSPKKIEEIVSVTAFEVLKRVL